MRQSLHPGTQDQQLVLVESPAAAGEKRAVGPETRPVLLATAGGEPSDAPAVWQHGAAHLGATAACGITETAREERFINNEARDGEVSEKSLRDEAVAGWQGTVSAVSETLGGQFYGA